MGASWQYCRDLGTAKSSPVERPEVLIPGLLLAGSPLIIGGAAGIGKSRLAMQLAFCLASGKDFLGWKIHGGHKVLYVQVEMALWTAENRMVQIAYELGVEAAQFTLVSELGWEWRHHHTLLSTTITALGADVVILDPLVAIKPPEVKENDNDMMADFCYKSLGKLIPQHNLSLLVVVHHVGKINQELAPKPPLDLFRGASSFGGWPAAGLVMYPTGVGKTLAVAKDRDFPDLEGKLIPVENDGILFRAKADDNRVTELLSDGAWWSKQDLAREVGLTNAELSQVLRGMGIEGDGKGAVRLADRSVG